MALKNIKRNSGFTIVELLIVIVVIAILATISIVAYNGVQARARASSAQALSSNLAKKSEIYNTDPLAPSGYPATLASLTGAATSTTYYVDPGSVNLQTTAMTVAPASSPEKTIVFNKCGHSGTTTSPANLAAITTQTGIRVDYWNNGSVGSVSAGQASGSVGTFPVACWPVAS